VGALSLANRLLLAVGLAASAVRPVAAHVGASPNANNRYLKLTPLGDRIRLAYTIYFGEVPGAALRRQLDADRSGVIEAGEADRFGRQIAAEVRQTMTLSLDGAPVAFEWTELDVGLGTPEATAGSFALDLVTTVCLPSRGLHELVVQDDYPLSLPGETELKVETGLGVRIERIAVGGTPTVGDDVRLNGPTTALSNEGWAVKLDIGAAAPAGGGTCGAGTAVASRAAAGGGRGQWIWILAGAAAAAVAGVVLVIVKRRRR
jgi:hypothetical protein